MHIPLSSKDRREACPICFDEANPVKVLRYYLPYVLLYILYV